MHYVTIDSFMRPLYVRLSLAKNQKSSGGHFLLYRWAENIYEGLPESIQGWVSDLYQCLLLDLIPDIPVNKLIFHSGIMSLAGSLRCCASEYQVVIWNSMIFNRNEEVRIIEKANSPS
jgi:hypothetical protein